MTEIFLVLVIIIVCGRALVRLVLGYLMDRCLRRSVLVPTRCARAIGGSIWRSSRRKLRAALF